MIYVISNVQYPEDRKIQPREEDLLVFLNKAKSIDYYPEHHKKLIIRRSPEESYGTGKKGIESWFVYKGPEDITIPKNFIDDLKKNYDWDFEIAEGKARCPTTGYMAIKYLEYKFPNEEIILVNFGYEVKNSSYRCPYHNWRFESKELEKYKHLYTTDKMEYDSIEVVYGCDKNRLEPLKLSIASVLRHNPKAHITVISPEKLELPNGVSNILFDINKYKLFVKSHISNASYIRFFIPEILADKNRAIYLETDVLCRGCMNELWELPVKFIGATHSHNAGKAQAQRLGLKTYHLGGVLLMNLEALRNMGFTQIAAFATEHFLMPREIVPYCDEGILNVCFDDYIKTIPTIWNYCVNRNYSAYNEPNVNNNTAKLLHYIGGQLEAMRIDAEKEL